eukprot:16756-Heterococcus_DN1.PRE.1
MRESRDACGETVLRNRCSMKNSPKNFPKNLPGTVPVMHRPRLCRSCPTIYRWPAGSTAAAGAGHSAAQQCDSHSWTRLLAVVAVAEQAVGDLCGAAQAAAVVAAAVAVCECRALLKCDAPLHVCNKAAVQRYCSMMCAARSSLLHQHRQHCRVTTASCPSVHRAVVPQPFDVTGSHYSL